MKTTLTALAAAGIAATALGGVRIAIDHGAKGHDVPKTLYGIFFEDINHAADGGVYPELIENRGFDWKTKDLEGWQTDFRGDAMARVSLQDGRPVHPATARHLRIECFGAGDGCGVKNFGYGGVSVEAGKKYDLTFYARGLDGYRGGLRCVLERGGRVLCEAKVANSDMSVAPAKESVDFELPEWKRHAFVFEPRETVSDGTFSILLDAPGAVEIEQVSLYPQDTFNGRKNGLRKDLVQWLKDMKPGVLRFPGGCIAEGHDFQHWFDWKRTVGALERRETIWNTWGYWQSMGLGYYEYFCLAEDIGAEPLPICIAGLTCQFRGPKFAPMESMEYFADNICDLIDFANADPETNVWGKLRADMGHPAPFNLKYVGIGNENWDKVFLDRYLAVSEIVRKRHPEIRIVSSSGAQPGGREFELAWSTLTDRTADVIDEHYYIEPHWMIDTESRYDKYARAGKPHVYAGEYAAHEPDRANNLHSALCEAVAMTGFERNSDVVEMTSYAPLFNKVGWNGWKPDLIWFDNLKSFGTPNYYVQKMFSANRPTKYRPSAAEGAENFPKPKGAVGFSMWTSVAEFKDIKVTAADGGTLFKGFPEIEKCPRGPGARWRMVDGAMRQENGEATWDSEITFGDSGWRDYDFTCRARKVSGKEGFSLRFCVETKRSLTLNIGGWGNTRTALQGGGYEIPESASCPFTVEEGRWYDVAVSVRGGKVSAKIDGKALWNDVEVASKPLRTFYHVCGIDESTNEYIVKCVNLDADGHRRVTVDFGERLPPGSVKIESLSGDPKVVNDLGNPTRCATKLSTTSFAGGTSFTSEVEPFSLTVFRIGR